MYEMGMADSKSGLCYYNPIIKVFVVAVDKNQQSQSSKYRIIVCEI